MYDQCWNAPETIGVHVRSGYTCDYMASLLRLSGWLAGPQPPHHPGPDLQQHVDTNHRCDLSDFQLGQGEASCLFQGTSCQQTYRHVIAHNQDVQQSKRHHVTSKCR